MRALLLVLLLLFLLPPRAGAEPGRWAQQRREMVQEIRQRLGHHVSQLGLGAVDEHVLDALARVPRHAFVPEENRALAYADRPLPIGRGQTISQPFVVAFMSQLLRVEPGHRVFELGTGSGYQAAVLAEMGAEVWTVEILPDLAERARDTLQRLGVERVHVRAGDGYAGWPEAAPFDRIIVTAAGDHVPPALLEQLKEGGVLVMPVGEVDGVQELQVVEKGAGGELTTRSVLPVRFVPLTGEH